MTGRKEFERIESFLLNIHPPTDSKRERQTHSSPFMCTSNKRNNQISSAAQQVFGTMLQAPGSSYMMGRCSALLLGHCQGALCGCLMTRVKLTIGSLHINLKFSTARPRRPPGWTYFSLSLEVRRTFIIRVFGKFALSDRVSLTFQILV